MENPIKEKTSKPIQITNIPPEVLERIIESAKGLTIPVGTRCRQILVAWAMELKAQETQWRGSEF